MKMYILCGHINISIECEYSGAFGGVKGTFGRETVSKLD